VPDRFRLKKVASGHWWLLNGSRFVQNLSRKEPTIETLELIHRLYGVFPCLEGLDEKETCTRLEQERLESVAAKAAEHKEWLKKKAQHDAARQAEEVERAKQEAIRIAKRQAEEAEREAKRIAVRRATAEQIAVDGYVAELVNRAEGIS
jgi:hypothetical protein